MATPLLPDAFFRALDDAPDDATTLCALADWYEEQGDESIAACVRWTIRQGLRPYRFSRADYRETLNVGSSMSDGWYWWVVDEPNGFEERSGRLPPALWNRLEHSFPYMPSNLKEYPSRRSAYEALFEAWPVFAPRNRMSRQKEGAR